MIFTPPGLGQAVKDQAIAGAALAFIQAIFDAYPEQKQNFAAGVGVMISVKGRDMNITLHKPNFPGAPGLNLN
jgi:hypothetical protein